MLMWSSFDSKFFNYGIRMYRSFAHFHPEVEMCFGDFGCITDEQEKSLREIGVRILKRKATWIPNYRGAVDLLAIDFFRDVDWDRLMWIDADTLIIDSLSDVFEFSEDYVGMPPPPTGGRNMLDKNGRENFALGFWTTSSTSLLERFYEWIKNNRATVGAESPSCTRIIHESECSFRQLDIDLYSFGRDAILIAKYDGGRVYYEKAGKRIYPKLAHFSRAGAVRHESDFLNKWYEETIKNGIA